MTDLSGILILSDLDGTLLNDSLDISPENRAAIDDFIGKGGRFTVATGQSTSFPGCGSTPRRSCTTAR